MRRLGDPLKPRTGDGRFRVNPFCSFLVSLLWLAPAFSCSSAMVSYDAPK